MTIDMHRDPSLRESAAYALFGSRTAKLKLPSSSDLSSYTATRNLPSDNPVQAVKTMEETCVPPAKLSPQQKQRPRRRTAKPALCYTVYWEADHGKRAELELIDQSLAAVHAQRLQALIVGRADYPPRAHVIVNVVDPETGRSGISPQPYYELMRFHLSTEPDPQAAASLKGMGATTIDSLRRQDHRLLDLPPLFAEAIRGVPGYPMESNAMRMVHRAGPSTFHTAAFIDTVHAEIHEVERYSREERNIPRDPDAARRAIQRKRDTRRKILVGDFFLTYAEKVDSFQRVLLKGMDDFLDIASDRALFGLPSLEGELLIGFKPKRHQREWCAIYTGDPTTLPDNLIGCLIEIQPLSGMKPWTAPITDVVLRSDTKLIVRTTPRNESYEYRHDD